MEKKRILKSGDRILELIEILATIAGPLSVAEVSDALDMNRTTAYGLINTLESRGFIERDQNTNKYSISAKLFELGSKYLFKLPFLPAASAVADKLVSKWHLSVHIMVYQSIGKILFVHMHVSENTMAIPTGYVAPAYCTAGGKILMASLPVDVQNSHIEKMIFEKRTKNTFTDKNLFKKELMQCREQGYSIDKGEFLEGTACISAPIFDFSGEAVASISISGSSVFVMKHEKELIDEVKAAAKKISTARGYSWGTETL
ncbi:MAG: IclR family transcriptional regulator [Clostridiaceae bacterium]